jgi:SAM-dependent methyltransferase
MGDPHTWHHGLVADWWAEFNTDGPEIAYFARFFEAGQPVLDAGCGTGRLLVPWLRAGHDVDGCDASADMIARCLGRARREGFDPLLLVQPLHELDPPRRYRTVVACGVFGLGTTRAQDEEALRRLHASLEPGGLLLLDNEVPYGPQMRWSLWPRGGRATLPEPWPEPGPRRRASDGSEYGLRSRAVALDPLDQSLVLEMRAEKWRDGVRVAAEEHSISIRGYLRDELLLMLDRAGFRDVDVRGDYTDDRPTPEHEFLVFHARA